eukprot:scaffold5884_cov110-Isochrysis_galbana.AAC.4
MKGCCSDCGCEAKECNVDCGLHRRPMSMICGGEDPSSPSLKSPWCPVTLSECRQAIHRLGLAKSAGRIAVRPTRYAPLDNETKSNLPASASASAAGRKSSARDDCRLSTRRSTREGLGRSTTSPSDS